MNTLDSLFSWFVAASVRGALLALAVLAIQAALRGRMPARWRYALWLPVIFVLVVPSLPQSRWSIEGWFAPRVEPVAPIAMEATFDTGPIVTMPAAPSAPAAVPGIEWRRVVPAVWLAGVGALLVFALTSYARTMRRIRQEAVTPDEALDSMLAEAMRTSGLGRAPRLVVSRAVGSPAVTGFLRATLLLPADFPGAFNREEARLVLLHELMHLKRHDLPLNWLLCLLQAIHWCNPVLWFAFARMRADREAACDAQVLAAMEADCRADYGHALLKLEGGFAPAVFGLGFLGIFERASGLRARMRAVATYRRSHPAWAVLSVGLIGAIALVGGTRAQQPAPELAVTKPLPVGAEDPAAIARITEKLEKIVLARLELREATVEETIDFLKKKSQELDTTEPDPAKRGINFVLNLDGQPVSALPGEPSPAKPKDAKITISLRNIPLIEAVKYVTSLADLKYRVEPHAVVIKPVDRRNALTTREWPLTPAIISQLQLKPGQDAREDLKKLGLVFLEGSVATITPDGKRLVLRNTEENHDLIEFSLRPKPAPSVGAGLSESSGAARLRGKLQSIIIPRLEFREATLPEALDFLRAKSAELDTTETDPAKKGISFVLNLGQPAAGGPAAPAIPGLDAAPVRPRNPADVRISISLNNIPLIEAVKYVTNLANTKFRVDQHAVVIVPQNAVTAELITKEYKIDAATVGALVLPAPKLDKVQVPITFTNPEPGIGKAPATGAGLGGAGTSSGGATGSGGGLYGSVNQSGFGQGYSGTFTVNPLTVDGGASPRVDMAGWLRAAGVTFPEGASAVYVRASGRLIIRNIQENLDLVDALILRAIKQPEK